MKRFGGTLLLSQICLLLPIIANCKTKCAIVRGKFECPSDPLKAADVQVYLMDFDGEKIDLFK